jgi:transposase
VENDFHVIKSVVKLRPSVGVVKNRRKTQNGRPLRRYRRRWKVERLFAWLGNFRRLAVRWEHHVDNFMGFLGLARAVMTLRRL